MPDIAPQGHILFKEILNPCPVIDQGVCIAPPSVRIQGDSSDTSAKVGQKLSRRHEMIEAVDTILIPLYIAGACFGFCINIFKNALKVPGLVQRKPKSRAVDRLILEVLIAVKNVTADKGC